MLKAKLKECQGCGRDRVIWSKGLCQECANKEGRARFASTRRELKPGQKVLSRGTSRLKRKKSGKSKEVKDFYKNLIADTKGIPVYSAESGDLIAPVRTVNLAHIFPKESFPSVATHLKNIVFYTWEEHTRFDELLNRHEFDKLEREFPNSWPYVCSLIEKLLPEVQEIQPLKVKLEEYLNAD